MKKVRSPILTGILLLPPRGLVVFETTTSSDVITDHLLSPAFKPLSTTLPLTVFAAAVALLYSVTDKTLHCYSYVYTSVLNNINNDISNC